MTFEAFAIGSLCLASLLALVMTLARRGVSKLALVSASVCVSLALAWWVDRSRAVVPPPPTDRPVQRLDDGYVSSDACGTCHPSQHASWHSSYHRTMTQVASPESVMGDFADVDLHVDGEVVRLMRDGDDYLVELREVDPRTGLMDRNRVRRRIVLVTGSHHMQVYWYATTEKRTLAQLPFAFLIPERRWVPVTATFLAPPGRRAAQIGKGSWNFSCLRCHTTRGQSRMDVTVQFDSHVAEFGIACEACHGPAEGHVLINANPLRRYGYHLEWMKDPDPTTLVPDHLQEARASEVCGQCHSIYHVPDSELSQWNAFGFRYRPGDDLSKARSIVRVSDRRVLQDVLRDDPSFVERHFWSDGMARVSGREYNGLIESPCYVHGDPSRGILSCTSCHQMHRTPDDERPVEEWANDQLSPESSGNAACESCHPVYRDPGELIAHTHHAPESAGSQCYNCHMPYTSYGLLKAIRSHQISSPDVATDLAVGRPNACNQCHLDQTLAWSSEWLERWYGISAPELSGEDRDVAVAARLSLSGDAGQRALMAWSMGWPEAQRAAGVDWMAPYLAQLMVDDYDAIRYIAARSFGTLPGFEDVSYDFLLPVRDRNRVKREIRRRWSESSADQGPRERLLIRSAGRVDQKRYAALLERRDERPVDLAE
jgi:hypothetical protein